MTDINVGQLSEAINGKMDRDGSNIASPKLPIFLVDVQYPTVENDYTWYRLYSDGWVEQGGKVTLNGTISSSNKTVNLPIQMANTKYYNNVSQDANAGGTVRVTIGWQSTTSFTVGFAASGGANGEVSWQVCGMAAQQ